MNRGVLQSSPVQQLMAAGGHNWWNINTNMRPYPPPPPPPHSQLISHPHYMGPPPNNLFPPYSPPPSSSSSSSSLSWHDHIQEVPESWSQLLMGGIVIENQDKSGLNHIQPQAKKLENWEEQLLHHHQQQIAPSSDATSEDHIKQENSTNSYQRQLFGNTNAELIHTTTTTKPSWPQMMPVSSPKSCVTSLSSNMLDFSNNKADDRLPPPVRSSECNSAATGGAAKKARVQTSSSTQSTFKVRKEKLGDRITALHQLVSPFGKTDTASVLLEAIGYIRFLQSQIEALSLPFLGSGSGNNMRPQQQQQRQSCHEERSCLFPEDPGELLNDNNCLKRKVALDQEGNEEGRKDLRSRGLCLVPISCTVQVGSDNGADYWAPAAIGGGFQ